MRIDVGRAVRVAGTLLLAWVAALLAERMHVPLPWMIGPLLAVALAGVLGARVERERHRYRPGSTRLY